ncbi:MAG: hypothetical protein OXU51_16140 [Candidatus Poribacteria bacterium]|nr:hypothetical protein [Candidatus Poribacteria bacterium]
MPQLKWDGPYYAACVAKRVKNTLTGWAKARGIRAVRNGSYMVSMGMDVMPKSNSNIRGAFSDDVSHNTARVPQRPHTPCTHRCSCTGKRYSVSCIVVGF